MTSVAVIGAGAIGGYVAAAACRAGHDVRLCVRSPLRSLRVDCAVGTLTPPVRILRHPQAATVVDWVVLTTKAHDTVSAAQWFEPLCGPQTTIVVMQNGVDHLTRLRPLVGRTAILPALVHIAVDRVCPGHIKHHDGHEIVLPAGSAADAFAHVVRGELIQITPAEDFLTASWRKLLLNVAANPITALTGQRLGVLDVPEVRDLMIGVLREAVAVGQAAGARLTDRDVDASLESLRQLGPRVGTSMLSDRLAGRPLEYELITGAVIRAGARHGVPVPLNQAMLALLRGVGHGGRTNQRTTQTNIKDDEWNIAGGRAASAGGRTAPDNLARAA